MKCTSLPLLPVIGESLHQVLQKNFTHSPQHFKLIFRMDSFGNKRLEQTEIF